MIQKVTIREKRISWKSQLKKRVYLQSLIEDGGTYGTDSPKSVKFSCTMKNTCMSEYKVKSRNRNDYI